MDYIFPVLFDTVSITPTVTEVKIKVAYPGPNRNGSYISRETLEAMGREIYGAPIIGRYKPEQEDFTGHGEALIINNDGWHFTKETQPYGFVGEKVWFQEFQEESPAGIVTREYLCVNGYLWTELYPETKRVLAGKNNQSMELGNYDGDYKEIFDMEYFIIESATINALCILGENFEPCYEGAKFEPIFALKDSIPDDFELQLVPIANALKDFFFTLDNAKEQIAADSDELPPESTFSDDEPRQLEMDLDAMQPDDIVSEYQRQIFELTGQLFELTNKLTEKERQLTELVAASKNYDTLVNDYAVTSKELADFKALHEATITELDSLREFKAQKDRETKIAMIEEFTILTEEAKTKYLMMVDTVEVDKLKLELGLYAFEYFKATKVDTEEPKENITFVESDNMFDSPTPNWVEYFKNFT